MRFVVHYPGMIAGIQFESKIRIVTVQNR